MMLAGGADPTRVIGRRTFAVFIDGIISALFLWLVLGYFQVDLYLYTQTARGRLREFNREALPYLLAVEFFYSVGVGVFLVGALGWTPGRLAMGLRVVKGDGFAPGLARGAVRGILRYVCNLFSCIYWLPAFAMANVTKGHRTPHDMVAGTYVIDRMYWGRQIVEVGDKVVAGGRSMSKADREAFEAQQAVVTGVVLPKGAKATEPFYDKQRDTYVVFSPKSGSWMQLDKMSGQWHPLQ